MDSLSPPWFVPNVQRSRSLLIHSAICPCHFRSKRSGKLRYSIYVQFILVLAQVCSKDLGSLLIHSLRTEVHYCPIYCGPVHKGSRAEICPRSCWMTPCSKIRLFSLPRMSKDLGHFWSILPFGPATSGQKGTANCVTISLAKSFMAKITPSRGHLLVLKRTILAYGLAQWETILH